MKLGEDRINALLASAPSPAKRSRCYVTESTIRGFTYEVAGVEGRAQAECLPGRRTVIIVAQHFAEAP